MDILLSDYLDTEAIDIFNKNSLNVDYKPVIDKEELKSIIHKYDGIVVRSKTLIDKEIIINAKKLKVIGRAGVGIDNIDLISATEAGIIVMNSPDGNSITTAEHTIAMIMSLARKIPQANESTKKGKWEKSKFIGSEVTGKTLGLIGCGKIGSIVADRAIGLKMEVIVFDPFMNDEKANALGVSKIDLEGLLSKSDIVSLHVPLNDETRNIIDKTKLKKLKSHAWLINCARGGLVDEKAIIMALNQEKLGGAAIDVFEEEPVNNNALLKAKNLIVTPHLGASTKEAQKKVSSQVAKQICDYLLKGSITNAVNATNISPEEARLIEPYIKLAKLLGKFLGQVKTDTGNIISLKIELDGKASQLNELPIVSSVLVGFLGCYLDSVNFINASFLAKEKGLSVSSVKHDRSCDYQSLIRVTAIYNKKERTIAGTLIGGNKPRITEVQGISIEANFSKFMIYIRNYDLPGFIGSIGSVLGENKINIASFHLGRRDNLGEAIALIAIDQAMSQKLMQKIASLQNVVRADYLNFSNEHNILS